ncbi:3-hydroxyacyl-CoA dehydrogenase NAD-binding domain-containing protein [Bacillus taeanensis]|uniref:3-hydroxybutyryl-CoA dehydrogenase n=1 Tax=Bacillus taeanensis TaxID=273032 RepID=A0A366Y1N0_9BACI|nr:3-hydroxyacyl-CoA dehydrogenase NAD-binding domain-containing protein [Bacillus taeanensis]RBW70101.1 3-hydroxybutyryl-CoA dehydrogenase [Bacillus taeanensis]
MNIETVGVVGSGTMGSGIAQVLIQEGYKTVLYDITEEIVSRARKTIFARIDRLVEKGKLTNENGEQVKNSLVCTANLSEMKDCQVVIEAAPEKIEIKKEIFEKLENYCSSETLLATNTSSFSVTEIASQIGSPARVAGMHFFNPAPLMPLVEVIKGIQTSQETIDALYKLAKELNKTPVICEDTPGFIVNRVARPFYNEAIRIMKDQIASPEQIDRILKKAGQFKMGPFELQDLIGIDINFATTASVYKGSFGESRFRPHFYQERMVQSGRLGRKAGGGYFEYEK